MGEQQGEVVTGQLAFVPYDELVRIRAIDGDPVARARLFADACRLNVLYMVARAGSGHLGSSFSSLDIVSWLLLEELAADDVYLSSKGHDAPGYYAALLGLGRLPFEKLDSLRRLGGLPGHPDVGTTGIAANTGSLGMGVSKAKGMLRARVLSGRAGRIFVLTGDGELQEGQLWESLVSAANDGSGRIRVIVDHNKLQSDTFLTSVSDLGDLEGKFAAFGWSTQRIDGHDPGQLRDALHALPDDRPGVVIADTVKGRGVSFMEHTALPPGEEWYHYHSGAPSPDDYGRALVELRVAVNDQLAALGEKPVRLETIEHPAAAPPPPNAQRLVNAYGRALLTAAARDQHIVALDADLVLDTGLIPFRAQYRDRFIECGIAEQDMVSQASGLAAEGVVPVVHSFACFLSARPNEQIYNAATERRKIVYVGSLAGLLPGGPGHSHQAVRDIASLSGVPGLVMVAPATEAECERLAGWALTETTDSVYLRLCSVPIDVPFIADDPIEVGRGTVLREGDGDVVVIGYGPVMLTEAWSALDLLEQRSGTRATLIGHPWVNRIDSQWFTAAVTRAAHVMVVDDHQLDGGLGQRIGTVMAEVATGATLTRVGVQGVPVGGQAREVLEAHGLDAESLAAHIERLTS